MTLERYADWLGRGRVHQKEGRVFDALLCYRRALRESPRAVDAQFHLGEIAWQLGQHADALVAWRAVTAVASRHLASWHALADGYAATGQLDAAREALQHVLHRRPDAPRANALSVMLAAAAGEVSNAPLAAAVRSSVVWPLPLLTAIIVRVLSGNAHRDLPDATDALFDAAAAAPVSAASADAPRLIAVAAADAGMDKRAAAFADRYAQSCRTLHRPSMPLLWPLRTAGNAVRAGWLVAEGGAAEARVLIAALKRSDVDRCECTILIQAQSEAAADAEDVRALPVDADAAARAIASLDLDVLVDLAGLRIASGPLLARHPARAVWVVARDRLPAAGALAERTFTGDAGESMPALIAAFEGVQRDVTMAPTSVSTAAALSATWEDAVRAHQRNDTALARAGYAAVLDSQPHHAPALYLSGVLARAEREVGEARTYFRAAIDAAPGFTDALVALAALQLDAGDPVASAATARDGLAAQPSSPAPWRALGQAELKRGDPHAALAAFGEALSRDPTDGETHYNQGVAWQTAHNITEAARAYQRALAFRPDLHAANFNLGVIFDQQGNAAAAAAAFSQVLAHVPQHAKAYKALAETLLASGRVDAWLANFDRFERSCPDHLALAALALEVCAYRADHARLAHYLDGLREGRFTVGEPDEILDALQQLLYLLLFFDVEPELVGRHARTHDALARTLYGEPRPRRAARRPGRLRIGYLSGDFRNHVMGKMMWEALRHHDRQRFEVFGYATSDARDAWTERYAGIFEYLETVDAMSDDVAAQRIADDDLDVLIDLSTHTKGSRPGVLARKPARVQITHVASAGTLAMSAIDFKLTDRYADLDVAQEARIEAPLVMAGCVYPYRHIPPSPIDVFKRETLSIARGAVVIGAFCTPLKLSQRCVGLWRDVMVRVPNALLAFSPVHPSLRPVFLRIVAAAGIDASRVRFLPQGRDDAENQARYRVIDFVLDPMPYGGVNGTLEALDMGVPVVALVGARHAERTSYSILANLGVTDTVAQTGVDYVDVAVRLATDVAFAARVRERIREALRQSTLTDMRAHARNLEQAYIDALEQRVPDALADAGQ